LDIQLVDVVDKVFVVPQSIHGVLWLQTHFEEDDWDALTSGAVTIAHHDAAMLVIDAEDAELVVKYD
jgi:hypothetical protein